ncbi:hypothetical protein [Aquimarina longa]|uniref:hypothetical protein n=1 Tax=Aquimarina longa TaxID=1080221 RepID=UPI0007822084|nr:hypothetical protein [Aquimarina longa]
MKKGIISIGVAIIGMYFIYRYNLNLYDHFITYIDQPKENSELDTTIFAIHKTAKIITLCIGLLSLYFGIISFLNKNKIGKIGIILAVLVIICAFIPFWQYFVEEDSLIINFTTP